MTGNQLLQFRKASRLTQVEAALGLGVSQTYLSLLEKGRRPLTDELRARAVRAFCLPPTELPLTESLYDVRAVSNDELGTDLASLGYPGYAHMKKATPKNPAVVLLSALKGNDREPRDVEALPWVALTFSNIGWSELTKAAKANDLQNRLGFVTTLAREVSEVRNDAVTVNLLRGKESELQRSMLLREETLCRENMTNAERKWLVTHRPNSAKHWRLLTDLSPRLENYE